MGDLVEVKVDGLNELTKGLKAIDKDLPKAVRLALNVASESVAKPARGRVPTRSGKAAGSIKAASTRKKSRVRAGGRRAVYYAWLDFGGSVGRSGSIKRQFRKRGRYLYLEYFQQRDSGKFGDILSDELVELAQSAGIEMTT